ncbi:MAG: pantoate--beta-alanine ligase [Paludibacteraceae bacterium]|nr:pantoate--beta-alanine ligase [Paludibacteraceae bacterium]
MKLLTTTKELTADISALKTLGKTIGFVPTMGALHDGHFSLVRKCKSENDICVVSIFVNPTQFNNPNDLSTYPRTLEQDTKKLAELGCDMIFAPSTEEMYTTEETNNQFSFNFGGLDQVMEGPNRPGHFNGVVQIVSKLFDLVQPLRAYFGEKDFQQVAIIKHMVKVMGYDTIIIPCPIVREASGLAMSSRNQLLSPEQKVTAAQISHILFESRQLIQCQSIPQVQSWVIEQINRVDGLQVEYFEIVDRDTLQPATTWNNTIGCITVHCGSVRLIDNITYQTSNC